jgi:hypothetical protein
MILKFIGLKVLIVMKFDKTKIDMVYLWCDGSDASFIKRKQMYIREENKMNELSVGDIRFYDNDELKYSLRSLEKNAPWIRHVYIVTDRQVPKWLNTSYDKVTVIDHSDIMPKNNIPCFNSSFIERYIAFIPGLSEYFLYGNDDTFFGEKVSPSFFYDSGKPIVRVKYFNGDSRRYDCDDLVKMRDSVSFWGVSVLNSWKLLFKQYGLQHQQLFELHHNIDAFVRSDYIEAYKRYQPFLMLSQNRFRDTSDYQRLLFSLDASFQNRAVIKLEKQYSRLRKYLFWLKPLKLDGYCIEDKPWSLLALSFIHPKLFCINNSDKTVASNKILEKRFLEKRFPNKSSFEK